ncbi:DENN/MADD domain containing protein [Kipferlia bialata]|uniref:DENN/MADD domain containing protein n=1 Tax=Kipferlia bialata TaxID=797122 RepID=A0A9K3CX43_9EUKA|nr:DENN/MADD domain containing protein [Kipferlia bialata]|eukprot:g6320.t1
MTCYLASLCVVSFDLLLGNVCECISPAESLTPEERRRVAFLSFPDTHSVGNENLDTLYSYILDRHERSRLYAFVLFQQRSDKSVERGYTQRALVALCPLPLDSLWTEVLTLLAPTLLGSQPEPSHRQQLVKEVVDVIHNDWPDMAFNTDLDLPLPSQHRQGASLPSLCVRLPSPRVQSENRAGSLPLSVGAKLRLRMMGGKVAKGKGKGSGSPALLPHGAVIPQAMPLQTNAANRLAKTSNAGGVHLPPSFSFLASCPESLISLGSLGLGLFCDFMPLPTSPAPTFLWQAWMALLMGQRVLVVCGDVSILSRTVLSLVSLISPIPFGGHLRPYLTVYEEKDVAMLFGEQYYGEETDPPAQGSPSHMDGVFPFNPSSVAPPSDGTPPCCVVGVSNPIFERSASSFDHVLKVDVEGGVPVSYEWEGERLPIQPHRALLKALEKAPSPRDKEVLLREHFLTLTDEFLSPFDPFFRPNGLNYLRPLSILLPPPSLEPFHPDILMRNAAKATRCLSHDVVSPKAWQALYPAFLASPSAQLFTGRLREHTGEREVGLIFRRARLSFSVCSYLAGAGVQSELELVGVFIKIQGLLDSIAGTDPLLLTHLKRERDSLLSRMEPDLCQSIRMEIGRGNDSLECLTPLLSPATTPVLTPVTTPTAGRKALPFPSEGEEACVPSDLERED